MIPKTFECVHLRISTEYENIPCEHVREGHIRFRRCVCKDCGQVSNRQVVKPLRRRQEEAQAKAAMHVLGWDL